MGRSGFLASICAASWACGGSPPAFPEPGDATTLPGATTTASEASEAESIGAEGSGTSTAAATTDDDASAASDEGNERPAVCGDGVQQSTEPCDDANGSEIDGCTSSCRPGPTGVRHAGDPQASPLITYGNENPPLTTTADCPEGEAVLGLDIGWPKGVGGITVRCAALGLVDADPTAIEIVRGAVLQPLGAYPGNDYALACPDGEVLGDLSSAGLNGGTMLGFGGACRSIGVLGTGNAQTPTILAGTALDYQGYGMAQNVTECPAQTVATGITLQMQASQWPIGIGLRCHALELAYP